MLLDVLESIAKIAKALVENNSKLENEIKIQVKTIMSLQSEVRTLKKNKTKWPARKENINNSIIISKYIAGESLSQIARAIGCDKNTVKNRLLENGITLRK